MVAVEVHGNNAAVSFAGSQCNLELNVFKPVMIHNLLHSVTLVHDACQGFVDHLVQGIDRGSRSLVRPVNPATAQFSCVSSVSCVRTHRIGPHPRR